MFTCCLSITIGPSSLSTLTRKKKTFCLEKLSFECRRWGGSRAAAFPFVIVCTKRKLKNWAGQLLKCRGRGDWSYIRMLPYPPSSKPSFPSFRSLAVLLLLSITAILLLYSTSSYTLKMRVGEFWRQSSRV